MSPERWQQIEAVFQAAIDLPKAARTSFLDSECKDDAELRREVERLLVSDASANEFIESPVWTDSAFFSTSVKNEISDSFSGGKDDEIADGYIGRIIGAFKITKEIGRGGMGAVYLAERADGEFHQRVAIKLIKRGMDSDFIIRRFRHERQILASFEHPFIARLLDGGTTADGVPYFVMEFVEGQTLYHYCDSSRLDTRERLKIFQKICSALEYAHSRQIIHRDIKPSNILINRNAAPKLLDFGIAKILDPNLIHESINPTASMLRMMTPDYASPEQVQGTDVTPSSDIYSLGVLLYELLTGHRPYNFAGRAMHEVSHVICNTMPALPSRVINDQSNLLPGYLNNNGDYLASRRTTAPKLSSELAHDIDDMIMKALNKDPEARYLSVGEFSKDISRYLNGGKILAPKYSERKTADVGQLLKPAGSDKALAVLPFSFLNLASGEDTDDRFLGIGIADALITRLSKVKRFVVRPTSSISSFGEGPIDPVTAGRDLNVDFILNGSIKKANDRVRVTVQLLNVRENAAIWATSIDEVLSDVFTLEDKLAAKVVEGLLPQLTTSEREDFVKRGTENPEAFEHYLRGRYFFNTFTEESFAKAFVHFHSAISADPDYALAYSGIADYYNWLGILGVLPPQECFLPAIEAARKAVELDANLSEAHASLGFSLHAGNFEWSRAEHHLKRAIELSPSNASAFAWYSIVMYTEGRFAEGLQFARRAIEIDPLTPFNHHNAAWGQYFAREFEDAAKSYRKVIADFPTYSFGYYGLSKVQRITGETRPAIIENSRSMELMGNSIFSRLADAECLAANGQRENAYSKVEDLEREGQNRFVSPYQLALVYSFLKENDKVIENLEKAFEIKESWLNWMGVDPAFDSVRGDERFEAILEKVGYRPFFNSFSTSATTELHSRTPQQDVHNLTTLVIDESDVTDDGTSRDQPKRGRVIVFTIGAILFIALLAAAAVFYNWNRLASGPGPSSARLQNSGIVVLPFSSSDPSMVEVGTGFADALSNKLGNIKSLKVIAGNTSRALTEARLSTLNSELGIAYVLRGSIEKAGGPATIAAELVDTRSGNILFTEKLTSPENDLFGLQTKLAELVWRSLGIDPLPIERQQIERRYTNNVAAYALYLQARSVMTNRSVNALSSASATFSRAINEDAGFALAYVGLADTLSLLNLYSISPPAGAYDLAKKNVTRALEIDPDLAEAHATLGYIKFFHERDRAGSELEFRRAIQINPSYAPAHHWFALTLAAQGEKIDAETEIELAKRLDPKAAAIRSAGGVVYYHIGDPARAIVECESGLTIDEAAIPSYKVKRWSYTALGDAANARLALAKEMEYSGASPNDPGWKIIRIQIDAATGDKHSLLAELERSVNEPSIRDNPYGFAYEIALAYNALGESSKALGWIERAEQAKNHSFNFLGVDPRFGNLHNDPRFTNLLTKLTMR